MISARPSYSFTSTSILICRPWSWRRSPIFFRSLGKDDHHEEAKPVVLAELEEMDASIALLDSQHFPGNAASCTDVVTSFGEGDAGGCGAGRLRRGKGAERREQEGRDGNAGA